MGKKKSTEDEGKSKFELALEKLDKAYGKGTVISLDSKVKGEYDTISTGSIGFDWITLGVGGFVKGRMYELMGWDGCLAEDTYIKFINVRPDGIVQDCKGSTIKNLYKRFHTRTDKTINTIFNVISINENNRILRNEIADVVKSGKKECFNLTTSLGFNIKATKDHKFYTGETYVTLESLKVGDTIYVHNNTTCKIKKKTRAKKKHYTETTVKWYYRESKRKIVNGCLYYRERVCRLMYEAYMNNVSYEDYIKMLNTQQCIPDNWWTIPDGYQVHHIDEDTKNNSFENLQLYTCSDHSRHHSFIRHNDLRFRVVPDIITNIASVGEMETYDIKCYSPYHNFIAEGIVVHNSGKSTICGHAVAECQKAGGKALIIDGEHAIDKKYLIALGVDTSKLLISQPASGEEGFKIAEEIMNTGEIDLCIIDSDSSLIPKSCIIDGDIGDSTIGKKARLNSNAYPRIKNALVQNKVCVLITSQYREKIGALYSDPKTTQGGHALKFYADCRIEVSKSLAKDGDITYGNITKVKTIKNRVAPPYRSVKFDIVYGKGIDKIAEIIELGVDLKVIEKSGTWYSFEGTNLGQMSAMKDLLNDNEELYIALKRAIINTIKETNPSIE